MDGFRVLLVEDLPEVLDQLVKLLTVALPGSAIDTASTVEDAFRRIDAALGADVRYDLAILDFKLPRRTGEMYETDESICRRLTQTMPETVVSHITSYPEDGRILDHLNHAHPRGRPQGCFLDKLSTDFAEALVRRTREALHGARIERDLRDLFLSSGETQLEGGDIWSPGHHPAGSMSGCITDLCVDIAHVWTHLGSATKDHVRKYFLIREGPGGVAVVWKRRIE